MKLSDTLNLIMDETRALEEQVAALRAENALLRERAGLASDLQIVHPHETRLTPQERLVLRMLKAAKPGVLSAEAIESRLPAGVRRLRESSSSTIVRTLVARIRQKLGSEAVETTSSGYRFGRLPECSQAA
jgi:DNA-binding response OmpR family regulator